MPEGAPDASVAAASFDALWSQLAPLGRHARTGGYRRYAWTREDAALREWFGASAAQRGLEVDRDRAGNLWAWSGDPDAARAAGTPGVVLGSHLDSVPDGGAFDGPLGVVSAFAVLDALRAGGWAPSRPVAVACFGDEEGARFGIACAGSRVLTGALTADRARGLRDGDGVTLGEAAGAAGLDLDALGRDDEVLARVGAFVELHVEQGRALAALDAPAPVAVGTQIWPHGRWRADLVGRADHAGTTALADRDDAMVRYATMVLAARQLAASHGVVATCGKVRVEPNGVNAIPSAVTGWLDARGADEAAVRALVGELAATLPAGALVEESWTGPTAFDADLAARLAGLLGAGGQPAPLLATGAGHDAGILAAAGVPTAMLFVRNPTGASHTPAEHAERDDCLAGVGALATVLADLSA